MSLEKIITNVIFTTSGHTTNSCTRVFQGKTEAWRTSSLQADEVYHHRQRTHRNNIYLCFLQLLRDPLAAAAFRART